MLMTLPSLKEIFPDHSEITHRSALKSANFDLGQAAGIILAQGLFKVIIEMCYYKNLEVVFIHKAEAVLYVKAALGEYHIEQWQSHASYKQETHNKRWFLPEMSFEMPFQWVIKKLKAQLQYKEKERNYEVSHHVLTCVFLLDFQNVSSSESSDLEEHFDLPLDLGNNSVHNFSETDTGNGDSTCVLQRAVMQFKEATIDSNIPRQLFAVCRSDGIEELKVDILTAYKNPNTNLKARPRVRFEGEEGVGAGPTREFFLSAVKLVEDGIGFSAKPVIYFEGEADHKVPVHNQALRQTGSFRAVGRILGHSFLHGGPSLCGLSSAVKHYFTCQQNEDAATNPPPIEIKDVPDVELQMLLEEVRIQCYITINV